MSKCHVLYEFRPRSVIITLGKKLYSTPETLSTIAVSLITPKQCGKVISQRGKFLLFMVHSEGDEKVIATSIASRNNPSMQQKQVDTIVEDYKDIFTTPV